MLETTFQRAIKIEERVGTVLHSKIASPTPYAELFKGIFKRLEAATNNGVLNFILDKTVNRTGQL